MSQFTLPLSTTRVIIRALKILEDGGRSSEEFLLVVNLLGAYERYDEAVMIYEAGGKNMASVRSCNKLFCQALFNFVDFSPN